MGAAFVSLAAAGLAAVGGCAGARSETDFSGFEKTQGGGSLDQWSQPSPNGGREEWGMKRSFGRKLVRHGAYTMWHANGQKAVEATYRNGKLNGIYRFWDRSGNLMGEGRFRNGNLVGD